MRRPKENVNRKIRFWGGVGKYGRVGRPRPPPMNTSKLYLFTEKVLMTNENDLNTSQKDFLL